MTPTAEQLDCIEKAKSNNKVTIEALAGSGKTSTLAMIANSLKEKSIYLAFNKISAQEASSKFPSHVECRTTHSLAYASHGHLLKDKLTRPKGSYVNVGGTGSEIAKLYKIKPFKTISANYMGLMVKNTVTCFEQSCADSLNETHIANADVLDMQEIGVDLKLIKPVLVKYAIALWEDRIDVTKNVLATHDTYMKLWQLSKPQLPYKIIYLDEAQDSSMCIMDVISIQNTAKIILVGDSRQNIYGWRGSVNAMNMVKGAVTCSLSKSFRFGKEVADIANYILANETSLKGTETIDSVVGTGKVDKSLPYTVLCRSNAYLLEHAIADIEEGKSVCIEIDVKDFIKLLESATALQKGLLHLVKHEKLIPYNDFADISDDDEDRELGRVVKLIKSGSSARIISILNSYTPPANPHIRYTTGHKSKGREFSQVILGDDFPSHYKDKKWVGLSTENQNILYVAATRAINKLDLNRSVIEAVLKYKPSNLAGN